MGRQQHVVAPLAVYGAPRRMDKQAVGFGTLLMAFPSSFHSAA